MMSDEFKTHEQQSQELGSRWATLREQEPSLRIRAAAERLGVSEVELLATKLGAGCTRLEMKTEEMFHAIPELGEVMCSARNEWAVIEKHGTYDKVSFDKFFGLVLDPEIDLRIFPSHFHSAFAEQKQRFVGTSREHTLRSIQFFDKHGTSLHKIYVMDDAGAARYDAFVERFTAAEQNVDGLVEGPRPAKTNETNEDVDVEEFQRRWLAMQDTHEFFGFLREFGVSRTHAMRIAPEDHAHKLDKSILTKMLGAASSAETPIMVFVGSPGLIEIHTGPVKKIVEMKSWLNVMDPRFNLHLDRDGVEEVWIVRKPTEDGIVTSIEAFDSDGETVALFFGARKPGIPEDPAWRQIVASVADGFVEDVAHIH